MKEENESNDRMPSQGVITYHERTKHHPNRYARSSGFLDWANEPSPFRRYEGATIVQLPLTAKDPDNSTGLYERENNTFQAFSFNNIATFLELSMGLSAWKSYGGNSWALRIDPSSGNLHPTEAHLVLPPIPENDHPGGVFHYNPFLHALEVRAILDDKFWLGIREHFQWDGFFVGLSSIYWRESWKYGERAFRYCNHDVGHAMACLSFSANLLGWKMTYLNALSDEEIEMILGFQKTKWRKFEKEHPDLFFFVHKSIEKDIPRDIPAEIVLSFASLTYAGEPNLLSREHVDWNVIDEVSSLTFKEKTVEKTYRYEDRDFYEKEIPSKHGAKIIRQRRSAQAYDGKTSISREHFFSILDKTIPRSHCPPFDLELGEVSVHLLIFVHRVSDLKSGLYFLIRNEKDFEEIKQKCHSSFLWERVKDTAENLPLYFLKEGDFRNEATMVSCQQEIAGDGVFSLGMIAKFRENIEKNPFFYRHLHWETGMIGQVLYLEAEAHSLRGTGIGCFFDDLVHQILGFSDNSYQDLYHFTIGGAIEDTKLATLPPYHHLKDRH